MGIQVESLTVREILSVLRKQGVEKSKRKIYARDLLKFQAERNQQRQGFDMVGFANTVLRGAMRP